MNIMQTLIRAVARGELPAARVVTQLQTKTEYSYGNRTAQFVKQGPGNFEVVFSEDGKIQPQQQATSPIEAKLMVLEYLQKAAETSEKAAV